MPLPTVLPEVDRAVLTGRVKAAKTAQRDVLRARIVLLAGSLSGRECARVLGCSRTTVRTWRARYRAQGLGGLDDRPRCGAPRTYDDTRRRELVAAATAAPPAPYSRWTHSRLAQHLTATPGRSPSPSWVARALAEAHIRVHRVKGWLHRKPDPLFEVRVAAIEAAVDDARAGTRTVVCLDEKTAVPVRTPCHRDTRGPDETRRREFEYIRAGTVSWYGTQDVTTGTIALHRAQERMDSTAFTMILDDLVAEHGDDLTIIMDNGSAHTSRHTTRWREHHPSVRVLFTPVHASWANPQEVVFSILSRQVITGGWFTSREDLDDRAQHWTKLRNRHPLPVRWSYQRRGPRTSNAEH